MNVVDSCGWLEYLADGPNAGFFADPVEDTGKLLIPTVSLYEVFERVLQQRDESAALKAVALMQQGIVIDLDASVAVAAARVSSALRIPMADSIMLATARAHGALLWTQDADFANVPEVRYVEKR